MFNPLKDDEDVIEDIARLNNICQEYTKYKNLWNACAIKFGIESVEMCKCRNFKNDMTFKDRLTCPDCDGIGYIFNFRDVETGVEK